MQSLQPNAEMLITRSTDEKDINHPAELATDKIMLHESTLHHNGTYEEIPTSPTSALCPLPTTLVHLSTGSCNVYDTQQTCFMFWVTKNLFCIHYRSTDSETKLIIIICQHPVKIN